MINVFKDNKKLNLIVEKFYERSAEESLEDIDEYLKNIDSNITIDFDMLRSICVDKNRRVSLELFRMYLDNFSYACVGVTKRLFYKKVENDSNIKYLQYQQKQYYTNFVDNIDDIEMILIHSLKQYYKIVKSLDKDEDLREIYAIYQTLGASIIHLLPEYYRKEFFNNEMYDELNSVEFNLENVSSKYIANIDYILRDYIKEKYGVDLFEYVYSEQRKRMISNKKD